MKIKNKMIFVRHAENIYDCNIKNDELFLTRVGEKQAQKVHNFLNNDFDIVYSSKSKRSIDTAKIICNNSKKIIVDDRLIEKGWYKKDGNETEEKTKIRVKSFLNYINTQYTNKIILVVTHGALIKLIQDIIENKKIERKRVYNCTVVIYNKNLIGIGRGNELYIPLKKFSSKEVLNIIRTNGGIPVLAHPFTMNLNDFELNIIIKKLIDDGLLGIEIINGNQSQELISKYIKLSQNFNLIKTVGSDFHSLKNNNIGIECDEQIAFDLLNNVNNHK